jgi:hypothetical protein
MPERALQCNVAHLERIIMHQFDITVTYLDPSTLDLGTRTYTQMAPDYHTALAYIRGGLGIDGLHFINVESVA